MDAETRVWRISDKDIVPDDVQCELEMIRSRHTMDYFRIGDIANDLLLESAMAGLQVTAQRIHKAVGRFCGKKPRTVRYYAENAAFYSPITRDEYDMLPFSFFDFARTFGEQWRPVLDWAALHPDSSLAQLQFEFSVGRILGHVNIGEADEVDYYREDEDQAVYESRCAKNDLNDDEYALVEEENPNLVRGAVGSLGAAEQKADLFKLVAEMGYVVEKAEYLLARAKDYESLDPESVRYVSYHLRKLQSWFRKLAEHMDDEEKRQLSVDLSQLTRYG